MSTERSEETRSNAPDGGVDAGGQIDLSDASKASLRRRSLLRAGGTGLLLTASSRPVWATGAVCTESALASANLSGDQNSFGCGVKAAVWSDNKDRWPYPVSPDDHFEDVFGSVKYGSGRKKTKMYPDLTLGEVISMSDDPTPGNAGKHFVAAYLNAVKFPNTNPNGGYMYTPAQVVAIFSGLHSQPGSSVQAAAIEMRGQNRLYNRSTRL